MREKHLPYEHELDAALYRPIYQTGKWYYVSVTVLAAVICWALYMYIAQLRYGLGVTGMAQPITWGFYIVNFVFFIGISHAGTLISAILRLSKAEWRRPITRMAEVITAIVLAIGGLHPILDLGRPDRMLNLFESGRLQSPLLWDVTSITAYFTASTVYLYMPMIPDIARLRDQGGKLNWLYTFLAWGWTGTEHQKRVLNRAINLLMVIVIPIAVSVHTVISYIFSMTLQPGWHHAITATDTAVIDLGHEPLLVPVRGTHGAHTSAGWVITMKAWFWHAVDFDVRIVTVILGDHIHPVHHSSLPGFGRFDDRDIVFCLTCRHAGPASRAPVKINHHRPLSHTPYSSFKRYGIF